MTGIQKIRAVIRSEDFLGKGNHEAARQGEETCERWEGSWALEGEADLRTTPQPKRDERPMARIRGKDKAGQVVHHA